jgi:hypothetical protein
MGLERRGRVKRSHDRGNWEQEDFDACDRHAVRLACLLDGSRMNREVHVRFCERPVVQSRRPTHPTCLLPTAGYGRGQQVHDDKVAITIPTDRATI